MRKSVIILALSLAACGPTGGGAGGSGGASGGAGGHNTGGSGGCGGTGGSAGGGCGGVDQMNPGCAQGAQYIYLVDENNHFFRYNPALPMGQRYQDLGALNCPATGSCAGGLAPNSPFS